MRNISLHELSLSNFLFEYSISLLSFDKSFFSSYLKASTILYSLMIQKKSPSIKDTSCLAGLKTIRLIEELRLEIAKLLPNNQLWGGTLSYDKFSNYLGMNEHYIRTLKNRVTNQKYPSYNPYFAFSNDQLDDFIRNLSRKFGKDRIHRCNELILKYKKEIKILDYRHQQWHIHNPNLRYSAFKNLDNTKDGYYFGLLLADGISDDCKNIGIFLEKEDVKVIERFRNDLQISNPIEHKIDTRKKKQSGECSEQFGIRVGCKPMIEDLRILGFFDFKAGEALEEGFFTNLGNDVRYSVLLGFYDGDGTEGTSKVFSTNRKFLEQIKREFNIRADISLDHKGSKRKFVVYKYCETKNSYYLTLGSDVFNKMMETYEYSMERKRSHYPLGHGKYTYEILRGKIKSKENLERLIRIAPIYKLMNIFKVSFETFKKLFIEWNVDSLPRSYWKRQENENWEVEFDEKFRSILEEHS